MGGGGRGEGAGGGGLRLPVNFVNFWGLRYFQRVLRNFRGGGPVVDKFQEGVEIFSRGVKIFRGVEQFLRGIEKVQGGGRNIQGLRNFQGGCKISGGLQFFFCFWGGGLTFLLEGLTFFTKGWDFSGVVEI